MESSSSDSDFEDNPVYKKLKKSVEKKRKKSIKKKEGRKQRNATSKERFKKGESRVDFFIFINTNECAIVIMEFQSFWNPS